MKSIKDLFTHSLSIPPIAKTATVTGSAIDLANGNENELVFFPGLWTDGTFALSVTESSDNTTYSAVAAADLVGTLANWTTTTTTPQKVGYIGSKRYLKPIITVTGSPTTGMVVAVACIVRPKKLPVSG